MTRSTRRQPDFLQNMLTAIGSGAWALISYPFRRRTPKLNQAVYQSHWTMIEQMAAQGDNAHYKQAIIEADKLVDQAFRALGIGGDTMGPRLKNAQPKFTQGVYNQLWQAHKLRNQLAHEIGFDVTEHEAKNALYQFKTALKELGAL